MGSTDYVLSKERSRFLVTSVAAILQHEQDDAADRPVAHSSIGPSTAASQLIVLGRSGGKRWNAWWSHDHTHAALMPNLALVQHHSSHHHLINKAWRRNKPQVAGTKRARTGKRRTEMELRPTEKT